MHMQKVKISGGAYSRLKGHMEREHSFYKNDVDIERSFQNITIVPYLTEEEMQNKAQIEASNKIRKDSVGSLNFVVTVPKNEELYEETDVICGTKSYEDWSNDIIDATLEAMDLKRSDILGAELHMDETSPHLHFSVMPLKQIDGHYKLCAKEIADKSHLDQLHDKIQAYMDKMGYMGRYVSEEVAERGLGKETLQEFKQHKEVLSELHQQKNKCWQELSSLNKKIKELNQIKKNFSEWERDMHKAISSVRADAGDMVALASEGIDAQGQASIKALEKILKGLEEVSRVSIVNGYDMFNHSLEEALQTAKTKADEYKKTHQKLTSQIKKMSLSER